MLTKTPTRRRLKPGLHTLAAAHGIATQSGRGQAQSRTVGRSRRDQEAEIGAHEPPRYLGGYGDYFPKVLHCPLALCSNATRNEKRPNRTIPTSARRLV